MAWCINCIQPRLGIIPVFFSGCTMLTFIITYMIAVDTNHLYPYFPSISDTGGRKPESNVFGLLLSMTSFCGFTCCILRYIQYDHIAEYNEESYCRIKYFNKVGAIVGVIACIGACVVASYQDRGKSAIGHAIGAICVFGGGAIYCWIQTYLSYQMLHVGMNSLRLCRYRCVHAAASTIFFTLFLILFYFSNVAWHNGTPVHDMYFWQSNDPGFTLHVLSSVAEWLCAIFLLLFFVSFQGEFNQIKIAFHVTKSELNILPFQTSTDEVRPLTYA